MVLIFTVSQSNEFTYFFCIPALNSEQNFFVTVLSMIPFIHYGNGRKSFSKEFVIKRKMRLRVKATNTWERWNEVLPQGQPHFLKQSMYWQNSLVEESSLEVTAITLRYNFIIDVTLADGNCILDYFIKLRLFFWQREGSRDSGRCLPQLTRLQLMTENSSLQKNALSQSEAFLSEN